MATRGEMARYWIQRSGAKKSKSAPRPRRDSPTDTALPGVSASDRRAATAPAGVRERAEPQRKNRRTTAGPSRAARRP